jgi:glycosyltransferase involved in cell wall biosynthesis
MDSPRIDIVTQFPPETTSLRNLYQSVNRANESWDVYVNRIQPPEIPGQNKAASAIRLGLLTLQTLRTCARLRWKTDLLIIHKPLRGELVERLFGIRLAERVFLSFDPVVYATFDANHVDNPEKCRLLFTQSDIVYATSDEIEQEVKKHTSTEQIAFIPPSVDTELFEPGSSCSQQTENSNDLVLGWVGYVEGYEENLWLLADAFDAVDTDGVALRFLNGGGQFPDELKRAIEATGVTLEIIDAVPHDSVPDVINSFDVGVAPLRDTEFNRGRSSEKSGNTWPVVCR